MKTILIGSMLAEAILIGYIVGRNEEAIKAALIMSADRAIAHAKSVPPALPDGYRFPAASELERISDSDLIDGKMVKT